MQFHFHANQSHFHKNGFETEAQGNLEMAYWECASLSDCQSDCLSACQSGATQQSQNWSNRMASTSVDI